MSEPPVQSSDAEPARRAYRSPARERAALVTRERIRAAAEAAFLQGGYAATTTKSIAAAAGVSERTLFLAFPTKTALLGDVIRARVRGDDDTVAVRDRESWAALLAAEPDDALQRFARWNGEVMGRTARILAVANAAALSEPEVAAGRAGGAAANRATIASLIQALAARGELRAGLAPADATDEVFAFTHEAVYLRLIDDCGWSQTQYERWVAQTLRATLLP